MISEQLSDDQKQATLFDCPPVLSSASNVTRSTRSRRPLAASLQKESLDDDRFRTYGRMTCLLQHIGKVCYALIRRRFLDRRR